IEPQAYGGAADAFALEGLHAIGMDNSSLVRSFYGIEAELGPQDVVITQSLATRLQVGEGDLLVFPLSSGREVISSVVEISANVLSLSGEPQDTAWFPLEKLQTVLGMEQLSNPVLLKLKPSVKKNRIHLLLPAELGLDSALT